MRRNAMKRNDAGIEKRQNACEQIRKLTMPPSAIKDDANAWKRELLAETETMNESELRYLLNMLKTFGVSKPPKPHGVQQ